MQILEFSALFADVRLPGVEFRVLSSIRVPFVKSLALVGTGLAPGMGRHDKRLIPQNSNSCCAGAHSIKISWLQDSQCRPLLSARTALKARRVIGILDIFALACDEVFDATDISCQGRKGP